jgi:hypothetical protein
MMASYNSDEHLLSAMNSSKRGMELRTWESETKMARSVTHTS